MTEPSVFTRIVNREIPAEIVAETDTLLAIRDIAPQAPVHVVIFPKTQEYVTVSELAAGDPALLAELVALSKQVADELCGGEYRFIFNSGPGAGQTVFHVHGHVLGGGFEEKSLVG